MIILVTFLILVMVIFSTRKNFKSEIPSGPNYSEMFFWQDNNKAYSLLLHSVTFHDLSLSTFSTKRDSILNFPAQPKELKLIKENILNLVQR